MNKAVLIVVLFVIVSLLLGGGVYAYIYLQGTTESNSVSTYTVPIRELLIRVKNNITLQNIPITNFVLFENIIDNNITTTAKLRQGLFTAGYNKIEVSNNTYTVVFSNDEYYSNSADYDLTTSDKIQDTIYLNPVADDVTVEIIGNLEQNTNNVLRVVVSTNKTIQDITICFDWSFNIIRVTSLDGYQQVSNPIRHAFVDKCYDTKQTIINSKNNFHFEALTENIQPYDYVKVLIIDKVKDENGVYVTDGFQGKDIRAKDLEVEIKP